MGKKGGKKGKAKRAKRASDASVKPFTGPASEAEANWGEKAPLLDGQSAGTREDWEKYFETATSADQRRAMIKKSADACFSKHPFARIYVQPLTKTIDMFVEAERIALALTKLSTDKLAAAEAAYGVFAAAEAGTQRMGFWVE